MSIETPPPPNPTPEPTPAPTPPEPEPAPPSEEWSPPTREEWEAQQTELNRARQAAARADRQRRDHTRQQQQAAGQFEELYNESRQELDAIRTGLSHSAVESAVAEAASRLRFQNPTVAHRLIDLAGIEAEVQIDGGRANVNVDQSARTLIDQRLQRLAEQEPYLLAAPSARQLPGAGHDVGGASGGAAAINQALRRAAGRA